MSPPFPARNPVKGAGWGRPLGPVDLGAVRTDRGQSIAGLSGALPTLTPILTSLARIWERWTLNLQRKRACPRRCLKTFPAVLSATRTALATGVRSSGGGVRIAVPIPWVAVCNS